MVSDRCRHAGGNPYPRTSQATVVDVIRENPPLNIRLFRFVGASPFAGHVLWKDFVLWTTKRRILWTVSNTMIDHRMIIDVKFVTKVHDTRIMKTSWAFITMTRQWRNSPSKRKSLNKGWMLFKDSYRRYSRIPWSVSGVIQTKSLLIWINDHSLTVISYSRLVSHWIQSTCHRQLLGLWRMPAECLWTPFEDHPSYRSDPLISFSVIGLPRRAI